MNRVSNTFRIAITTKPDVVFAYVSDLTLHGEWNNGLRIEALTPGPVGVGSRYHTVGPSRFSFQLSF